MSEGQIERLNAALEGRYRIERRLGEGGMATVYLADDLRHERKVALKVLKPELAAVVGADRFLAEIKTTANLQHPHILPLFDSGEADSFLFYVMPYVEGESLRERLDREHQLPVDEAVQIAKNVAEALDYAHRQGVIHRDIKPANILLQDGKPVVSDFGIALALGAAGAGRLTETGLSLGTPHYMSPEQATGDMSVGAAADIYALGCVLYEMLVGEPPYTGSTPQAVLGKIVTGEAPSARAERKSVPLNVDAAIRRVLEKVPADRFRRAKEVSDALSDPAFRYGNVTLEAGRVAPGLRAWAVGATAMALALAITTVWSLAAPGPSQPVSRLTIDRREIGSPPLGVGATIDISPDGSMLVFVGVSSGVPRLWLRPMEQLDAIELEGTDNARYPRFSPDGGSVAFIGDEGLTIASLTGGPTSIAVPDSMLWPVGGIDWGPNGLIYFKNSENFLARTSLDIEAGNTELLLPDASGVNGAWPDVLPDATGLLLSRRNGDTSGNREIVLVSLATGASTTLLRGEMARYAPSGHIVYTTSDGALYAVRFDADRLEVNGPPQAIADGIPIGTSTGASDFAISGTGVLFYRTGDPGSEDTAPVWIGRDGSEEDLDIAVSGRFQDPAISPDGRRVAFDYTAHDAFRDIWIFDLDQGAGGLRLTLDGPNNWQPFWNPDGTDVGFTSDREGAPSIYTVPSDRSAAPTLLREFSGSPLWDASFTPGGDRLVYRQANSGPRTDVLYSPPHPDSVAVALLDSPFEESAPSVSPSGQWLAYQSNESGQYEVYVSSFPERGGYTRVSVDGGVTPVWAHNGREIFYRDLEGSWIIATVRTDPTVGVESREVLHSGEGFLMERNTAQFDIAPDDQRILAIRRIGAEAGAARDVVVQGLFEELNRLVPTN